MERWEHQALEMSQVGTEAESKEGLLPTRGLPPPRGYHRPGATTAQHPAATGAARCFRNFSYSRNLAFNSDFLGEKSL